MVVEVSCRKNLISFCYHLVLSLIVYFSLRCVLVLYILYTYSVCTLYVYTEAHRIHACKLYVVDTTICPPLIISCIGNIDEEQNLNRIDATFDASVQYVYYTSRVMEL